jgi:KDO2-lipid IV(A) lauroyltransferase
MLKKYLAAALIKTALYPLSFLSFSSLHILGKSLGSILYYCITPYRKRALSNLSLAKDLHLSNEDLKKIAKGSFQNLAITCLEYPKLQKEKDLSRYIFCENPHTAQQLIDQGQGLIFFCGHQSNWEVLFLEGTQRMPGVAIGRPIKNPFLYDWVVRIRERFGGKIVPPQNALKEGLRALRQGKFLGIVGDQGMPGSGFSSNFLGTKAWTSTAPALLAYKTNSPVIVATTQRKQGRYSITYSEPIWPDLSDSLENQVPKMMEKILEIFARSIKENPGEWLWQHNRWKQETPKVVYYKYRYDTILILLPSDLSSLSLISAHLSTFRKIYPEAFITCAVHSSHQNLACLCDFEKIVYEKPEDLFFENYLFKLVFNFTDERRLKKHFLKKTAFQVLSLEDLKYESSFHSQGLKNPTLSDMLIRTLCRQGTLWN